MKYILTVACGKRVPVLCCIHGEPAETLVEFVPVAKCVVFSCLTVLK